MGKEAMIKKIYEITKEFRGKEKTWNTLFLWDVIWLLIKQVKTPSNYDHFMTYVLPLLVIQWKERSRILDRQSEECIKLVYQRLTRDE